jgi:hypothetical protein
MESSEIINEPIIGSEYVLRIREDWNGFWK